MALRGAGVARDGCLAPETPSIPSFVEELALLDKLLDNRRVSKRIRADAGGLVRAQQDAGGRPRTGLECLTRKRSLVQTQYRPPSIYSL